MVFVLQANFINMLYLTEQLNLNYLEGTVIEAVVKPEPSVYRYQRALEKLELLITSEITLVRRGEMIRVSAALDSYDTSTFNQSYSATKIVHMIANARHRSTLEGALQNYRGAAAIIQYLADTMEAVNLALPDLGLDAPMEESDDEMTVRND